MVSKELIIGIMVCCIGSQSEAMKRAGDVHDTRIAKWAKIAESDESSEEISEDLPEILREAIEDGDFRQTNRLLPRVKNSGFDSNLVVADIFSSNSFTQSEKINLSCQLKQNGVNLAAIAPESDGSTPLHMAVSNGEIDVASYLFKRENIDPNIKDESECTPLFFAPNRDMAELIIKNGGDLNARDSFGRTVLFWTAGNEPREKKLAKYYLLQGIKSNVRDNNGHSPYQYLEQYLGEKPNPDLINEESIRKIILNETSRGTSITRFIFDRSIGIKLRRDIKHVDQNQNTNAEFVIEDQDQLKP